MGRRPNGTGLLCRNCVTGIRSEGGGLCSHCYRNELIRRKFPVQAKYRAKESKEVRVKGCKPTPLIAGIRYLRVLVKEPDGTEHVEPMFEVNLKLEVLIVRASKNQHLFHPDDEAGKADLS
jgi:hypothetical protein